MRGSSRGWRIAVIAIGLIVATGVAAMAVSRHVSRPAYLEKRLSRKIDGYTIHIESSRYDAIRRTFVATGVTIVPDTLDHAAGGHDPRRTRYWVTLAGLRATGVKLWDLQRGILDVEDVRVEGLRGRVMHDRRISRRHPGMPRRMPHEVLMSADKLVRVGRIRVVRGDILYLVRNIDSSRPGSFRFAQLYATITNLRNDGEEQPCVIDVRTRLADSGLMNGTFSYNLSSAALKMDYRLAMKTMDATSFNDLLVDMKGIRIASGTIDSFSADIAVRGDMATGAVRLPYHGLSIELVDKDSHEQDFGDQFKSLMAAGKIHVSNPESDESLRVINIRRQRPPDISLLKFVWETVREGALRSAGIERLSSS